MVSRVTGGCFAMKDGLAALAGSSVPIAQSETMMARQRALISRLHAQGKPTATAEQGGLFDRFEEAGAASPVVGHGIWEEA